MKIEAQSFGITPQKTEIIKTVEAVVDFTFENPNIKLAQAESIARLRGITELVLLMGSADAELYWRALVEATQASRPKTEE